MSLQELSRILGEPIWRLEVQGGLRNIVPCNAQTPEEALKIYRSSPKRSESREAALKRILELTTDYESAQTLYYGDLGKSAQKAVSEVWNQISLTEIISATNSDEAEQAYEKAPEDSEAELVALLRWASFVEDFEVLVHIYQHIPRGSDCQQEVLKKIVRKFQERQAP